VVLFIRTLLIDLISYISFLFNQIFSIFSSEILILIDLERFRNRLNENTANARNNARMAMNGKTSCKYERKKPIDEILILMKKLIDKVRYAIFLLFISPMEDLNSSEKTGVVFPMMAPCYENKKGEWPKERALCGNKAFGKSLPELLFDGVSRASVQFPISTESKRRGA
jgi:hypothetical protein